MYSSIPQINKLTYLLLEHGVSHVVVCPGSRNAAIVRIMAQTELVCHPVTDERSAGFYALGIALATNEPVAVCVTSGSAVLNLAPAVAEAYYRHVPLIVISADRPSDAIGQLEGQTIVQPGALNPHVKICVNLPEGTDDRTLAYANRLINEALIAATSFPQKPVHINVPLAPPLFDVNESLLIYERAIGNLNPFPETPEHVINWVIEKLDTEPRPMIVIGQCRYEQGMSESIARLSEEYVVYSEALSNPAGSNAREDFDIVYDDDALRVPSFVLYVGDCIVNAKVLKWIKEVQDVWVVTCDQGVHDASHKALAVLQADPVTFIEALAQKTVKKSRPYKRLYSDECKLLVNRDWNIGNGALESMVAQIEYEIGTAEGFAVHYGNSSVVRAAINSAQHYIYVNRGVNGIEGSLSTAAGFSLATDDRVVCVLGDLSFFYDCNALWSNALRENLRIVVLNDGRGGIFSRVAGLPLDEITEAYVEGRHNAKVQGICEAYDIEYQCITDIYDLAARNIAIHNIIHDNGHRRPMLLEVML